MLSRKLAAAVAGGIVGNENTKERPRFSFGGCVYRLMVDTRHASSLAALAAASAIDPSAPMISAIQYKHTSNLPAGRCEWLRDQIADTSLRWAISVDGDTTFHAGALLTEMRVVAGDFAIGLAPVRVGGTDGTCNINMTKADEDARRNERPVTMAMLRDILQGDRKITSGGFGVAVFNLEWFRAKWPDVAPECVSILTGEDIELCRSVRRRGGNVALLNVPTDHYAWGEAMLR